MIDHRIIGDVDITVVNDAVFRHIAGLKVFDDNSVDTRCTGFQWTSGELEGSVCIGNECANLIIWNGCWSRDTCCFCKWHKVTNHWQVGDWCRIFSVAKLTCDVECRTAISIPYKRGDGLVDDLYLFCCRAGVERNPAKVSTAIGAVLLKPDFAPCCAVLWENCIPVAVPCTSGKSTHVASRQTSKTSHGDESGVEFVTRSLLNCFNQGNAHIFGVWNPRAVVISLEFGGSVPFSEERLNGDRRIIGIGCTCFRHNRVGGVEQGASWTAQVGELVWCLKFVRKPLTRNSC